MRLLALDRAETTIRFGARVGHVKTLMLPAKGEDALAIGYRSIAVADGATPIHETSAIVARFAQLVVETVVRGCDGGLSIPEAIRMAIERHAVRGDPTKTPSAAIVVARIVDDRLEVGVLGDCVGIVMRRDARILVTETDHVLRSLDAVKEVVIAEGMLAGLAYPIARLQIEPILEAQRRLRNVPGGYWVVADPPEAAEHVRLVSVPIDSVASILLSSDGLLRLVDPFRSMTIEGLMEQARHHGLASLGSLLRRLEALPELLLTAPRTSPMDDVTAVFVTVDETIDRSATPRLQVVSR
jgi:serine/threonine protein phosphatase PrpC